MSTSNPKGSALITGASSGIGARYAEQLARRGHDLILVARDQARLDALAARLREQAGVRVEVLRADLAVRDDLARVEQKLRDDETIALLVNNAGIAASGPLAEADPAALDALIALNVLALTRLAGVAAARFGARGRGAIVNIGSIVALLPERFNAVYSASKAYVLSLSQTLQAELASRGVQVQAVLPGATRTEIWASSGLDASQVPDSMFMEADELVAAALVGLDRGERVTIPSLPDPADWEALDAARGALGPNLSHDHAAPRYREAFAPA
ncbi:SDR family NAD(P)-dependent oxidoreductase [Chitinimonas koreensis]|uniref:SDR family NAD(P)-dependent oxidoreductase n=1 Tax=Chitinimonas koreensis TaxID=356302 RepID=UPI00041EB3AC|nr:SDR family oxidoreductase [Chitinimonas koreensis]QNM98162.1 SDR family oxidoreductase [Chitinimonas koreensis]